MLGQDVQMSQGAEDFKSFGTVFVVVVVCFWFGLVCIVTHDSDSWPVVISMFEMGSTLQSFSS